MKKEFLVNSSVFLTEPHGVVAKFISSRGDNIGDDRVTYHVRRKQEQPQHEGTIIVFIVLDLSDKISINNDTAFSRHRGVRVHYTQIGKSTIKLCVSML